MIGADLQNEYFEWMYNIVCNDIYSKRTTYRKLLCRLHDLEFTYILEMDGNRAEDGIDLRHRFGYECGYPNSTISYYLDGGPCSVLEMMIALALRCEDNIVEDYDLGNRVGQWFWGMVVNLGLGHMNNEHFDRDYVDEVIFKFLQREYTHDGEGGLFKVENCRYDMRETEIWYQMHYYLEDIGE